MAEPEGQREGIRLHGRLPDEGGRGAEVPRGGLLLRRRRVGLHEGIRATRAAGAVLQLPAGGTQGIPVQEHPDLRTMREAGA